MDNLLKEDKLPACVHLIPVYTNENNMEEIDYVYNLDDKDHYIFIEYVYEVVCFVERKIIRINSSVSD